MPRRFFELKRMKTISIDIETFSDINLTKCGVYKYAESPAFEILLFGYSVDGGKVQVVDLAQGERISDAILDALIDESVTKWAFNASFERVCLSRYLRDLGMSWTRSMIIIRFPRIVPGSSIRRDGNTPWSGRPIWACPFPWKAQEPC